MKKKEETNAAIVFQIKAIELLDTCVNASQQALTNNTVYQFDINLEHRLSINDRIVEVVCTVSICNDGKELLLGQLKTSCIYLVENLSNFINAETKALELPGIFITTLNSETISTTRGLMFYFLKGTFLHKAVLPIIDPNSLTVNG